MLKHAQHPIYEVITVLLWHARDVKVPQSCISSENTDDFAKSHFVTAQIDPLT